MEIYKKSINLVSNEFEIIKKLGCGSFGEVYLTKIIKLNKYVASKIEDKKNIKKNSKILDEYKIYKILELKGLQEGIPKIYSYYETPKFNVLVMELLGDNLDTLFTKYNRKFNLCTILKLSVDLIKLIEQIHNCGFVHRDIKPNNFMFGINDKKSNLYILDFGLSKKYCKNKKHIEYKTNKSLVGTARYTSINVHLGIEPSRRDDLESIGYMLVYFMKGSLPWQGLKKQKNIDQIELIGDVKLSTSIKSLCEGLPSCINDYLEYVRKLTFDEHPNYKYLKNLFINYASDYNEIIRYDFDDEI
jgi:serine/threonine protein kinase